MGEMGPVPPDPKGLVRAGYDVCAREYNAARAGVEIKALAQLFDVLPRNARVLEVGCGAGHPVGTALAQRAAYTGVDISPVQLDLARKAQPEANLILGDIGSMRFDAASFDAIVSFYTLFHVPRDEHEGLLQRFYDWLRPGGHLLISVARTSHEGYTEADFFGAAMFWSHFEAEWYVHALERTGFDDVRESSIPPGSGDGHDHPVLFARVPPSSF